jgi:small GTP-binding protein
MLFVCPLLVASGKTSALFAYTTNAFISSEHLFAVFDVTTVNLSIDDKIFVDLTLHDTQTHEDSPTLRPLAYPGTDIFLIFFSVASTASFEHVTTNWIVELKKHCPQTPFILVGTKQDLRKDDAFLAQLASNGGEMVTSDAATACAEKIGAVSYLECSSLTGTGFKHVFDEAAKAALKHQKMGKGR